LLGDGLHFVYIGCGWGCILCVKIMEILRILGARMTSSFSPKHSATNEDGSKVSRETESSIIASSRLNHFYGAYFSPVNEFGRVRILRRDLCAQSAHNTSFPKIR
jgi:hypothetical protein